MAKTILTPRQELEIVKDYTENNLGIVPICEKYHIGKLKVKSILAKYEVTINNKGKQPLKIEFKVKDFKERKYINTDDTINIVYDENTDFESKDIDNNGGVLTTYINKQYGVEIPTLYDRRMYYMTTGDYWWEQWLKVKQIEKPKTKKCPYCNWETTDLGNKSGMFETHLYKAHSISKEEYIKEHPEDRNYFALASKTLNMRLLETDPNKFIKCQICGKKFVRMTQKHLKEHGITREEYVTRYGLHNTVAKSFHDRMSEVAQENNQNMSFHRVSQGEREIIDFIKGLGFNVVQDRRILNGQELDIFIPERNVAIEYNGLYWHNELFKDKDYHLSKAILCEKKGIRLIQIFEDEWIYKQEIVESRLKNILGLTEERIYARKCDIKILLPCETKDFLEINHIQGHTTCKYSIGLFYNDELVSIMTFGNLRKNLGQVKKDNHYELLRFCNKLNTTVIGGASKLLKHFIKQFQPERIISYADKRWSEGCLYYNLGFKFTHCTQPNYFYVIRNNRENRYNFRKQVLIKNYNCPKEMSEHQFCLSNKWYRIYDCGNLHYELNL